MINIFPRYAILSKLMAFLLSLLGAALLWLLLAWPIMILWNWLMPTIFHLPAISFWQALGLNCLFSLFFKTSFHVGASASK